MIATDDRTMCHPKKNPKNNNNNNNNSVRAFAYPWKWTVQIRQSLLKSKS